VITDSKNGLFWADRSAFVFSPMSPPMTYLLQIYVAHGSKHFAAARQNAG
jgi:hypothetical protein